MVGTTHGSLARSGDLSIAYQVIGQGPFDLVAAPGFISHLEWNWQEPSLRRYIERLAEFSRLILFDKRGTGLSDREAGVPTLEQRMDDVRAVMAAAGSERAAVLGISEGGAMSALFAATYPERTAALRDKANDEKEQVFQAEIQAREEARRKNAELYREYEANAHNRGGKVKYLPTFVEQ